MLAHNDPARPPRTVAVTGASGFVGASLVRALLRSGIAVRAVVRRSADAGRLAGEGLSIAIVPDIAAQEDWEPVLAGADAVVHAAGVAHRRAGASDYREVNVAATERLAAAAPRAGVRRLVFLSSAKVNGESTRQGAPFREDAAPAPGDDYARSKLEAEARLGAVARELGLETVVLRPPLVYGPGVKANFLALLRVVDRGLPLPFAGIGNRRSLVYVGNLVSAVESCLSHPSAAGGTFFVADDAAPSTPELVAAVAAALGRSARLFRVPRAVLRAAAAVTGERARLATLYESFELDTTRIRSALGWRPPHAFADGIAATCRWFAASRR